MKTPEELARKVTGDCAPAGLGNNCSVHGVPLGSAPTCLHVLHLTEVLRARDAEVAEQMRAETLAGFVEERAWSDADGQRYFTVGYPASDPSLHTVRRLVGPWEPMS